MFTGACKITGNGLVAGCQLFFRKIYGNFFAVYCFSAVVGGVNNCRDFFVITLKVGSWSLGGMIILANLFSKLSESTVTKK